MYTNDPAPAESMIGLQKDPGSEWYSSDWDVGADLMEKRGWGPDKWIHFA